MSRSRSSESPVNEERLRQSLKEIGDRLGPTSPEARREALGLFKEVLANGRAIVRNSLERDGRGLACAERLSALADDIVGALFDFACTQVFRTGNPSSAERLALVAVGGYGRGSLAPYSDIDLLFLFPYKRTAFSENVTEWVLYMLWDLGLKVGHATRTVSETIKAAKEDVTVRTALLESRFLCGERALYGDLAARFGNEVVAGSAPEFIAAKLAERDQRHSRAGSSRYLVEPNVKESKGGQRDLQTLFWIAKYLYRVPTNGALVDTGLLSRREYRLLKRCDDFLWAVRCTLHFLAGRPEERLSFDVQPELARRLGYQKHPGLEAAERFMKHYFLVAKDVGDLTRIVCAELESREAKNAPSLNRFLRSFTRSRKTLATPEFVIDNNRINVADEHVFERDPVNILRFFREAGASDLAFHPAALRLLTKSLKLVDRTLQHDREANRLFLEILSSPEHSETVLRVMNETGVLGRFIPDFGRIVAMMQFNMYHHYTVDEHLLRTVGTLAALDQDRLGNEHPLSRDILPAIKDKQVLYVAAFLHDIAKGRPEDHSTAGARVARRLCPRLGLTPQQTELVAWLVEQHLTMSMIAQSRDLSDRKTITDFAAIVQTTERLKLLLVLTVCDIRAVGPGVWNGWKGQLLRTLYYETEPLLTGGYTRGSVGGRVAAGRAALTERLAAWPQAERDHFLDLHYPPYWLRVDEDTQVRHAELIRRTDAAGGKFAWEVHPMHFEGATEITILAPDHPRLLAIMAGACSANEANIVGAQIFTTADGRALDTLIVTRAFDTDEDEIRRGERVAQLIQQVMEGRRRISDIGTRRPRSRRREAFTIEPSVNVSNELSEKQTVVEIECLDRTGLLFDLTQAISQLNLDIASAHIATFGERAVDTFYVTDLVGHKITAKARQNRIHRELLDAIGGLDLAKAQAAAQ